jgi:DNA-binding winged helix-turn-helix (wHTH) protein
MAKPRKEHSANPGAAIRLTAREADVPEVWNNPARGNPASRRGPQTARQSMQKYRFGDFELDLDAFELRLRGEPVKLERRPLDLLVLLVRQPGRMVPREEIVAALWPPKVIIDFDSGLNTLVRKVRNALDDASDEPKFIETVPGRGYRFVAPVEPVTQHVAESVAPAARRAKPWRSTRAAAALVLLLAAGAAVLAWFTVELDPEPTRIAVLPFENLTGDDALAYLASGLAEDTSTSLAQIDPANLRVIGLSARPLPDPALSIDEIRARLGVDFAVTSSLRLEQTRVRVT